MSAGKKFYTYIVECSDNTYYTGQTCDIENRLLQHNGTKAGGAKYTRARRPVTLVYYEEHASYGEARKRENSLKQLAKKKKQQLIIEKSVIK